LDNTQGTALLRAGHLILDPSKRLILNGKESIPLNPQECRLLTVLMAHEGEVLTRAFLMQEAWGWKIEERTQARTLEVHIHWLRRKLEANPRHPQLIRTVRRVGYRFGRGSDNPAQSSTGVF
jgi:DNA-binding response OmpR family regulator